MFADVGAESLFASLNISDGPVVKQKSRFKNAEYNSLSLSLITLPKIKKLLT